MISPRRIPLFLLAILLMTGLAFSQTQITTGVIQGTVLDPSGAVIPGASVEAHNLDTQIRQAATSDENGRFSFLALTPGRYEVIAKKEGFSTIVAQGIDLTVGQARGLNLSWLSQIRWTGRLFCRYRSPLPKEHCNEPV